MDIGTLTNTANTQAEESFTAAQVLGFANDAISKVNIECSSVFPFMDMINDYIALPDKWQRTLLLPFILGRMKQVDSSQFEYSDSFMEFTTNLATFKAKYQIPEQYKDADDVVSFLPDYTGNPWGWN